MPLVKLSALNQNLELYYELHGSGKIKILLIMGLLTDGSVWACQVRVYLTCARKETKFILQTEYFRQQSDYQV